ncbi:MAG: polyhydroxyalkanoate synthesis repressor PhaR [Alphaproteobacteria bacterium]|nr:polyhydroxyalkanoate synthesis repressor PhaR [Alphaproteobacteria bacterium]
MADDAANAGSSEPVVIKKYANRRLYNTANSAYVTLDHLSEMVRAGVDFVVHDAKTGDDITRSVLTQIIFEQESRGQALLPVQFLRKLIRFYGDQMQGFLPAYLEMSMETFSKGQEQFRDQLQRAWTSGTVAPTFEEQARQNVQMFQQAMRLWSPFPGGVDPTGAAAAPAAPASASAPAPATGQEPDALLELKRQVEQMQKQLESLSGTARKP